MVGPRAGAARRAAAGASAEARRRSMVPDSVYVPRVPSSAGHVPLGSLEACFGAWRLALGAWRFLAECSRWHLLPPPPPRHFTMTKPRAALPGDRQGGQEPGSAPAAPADPAVACLAGLRPPPRQVPLHTDGRTSPPTTVPCPAQPPPPPHRHHCHHRPGVGLSALQVSLDHRCSSG